MPSNRKKLIRARMQETGENYQAALRFVRATEEKAIGDLRATTVVLGKVSDRLDTLKDNLEHLGETLREPWDSIPKQVTVPGHPRFVEGLPTPGVEPPFAEVYHRRMGVGAKRKDKIQARLGELRHEKYNRCWVCGSTSGTKTAREASGPRCKQCIDEGKTTAEVVEYEALKTELDTLNARNG
jgi:hypothetical protein